MNRKTKLQYDFVFSSLVFHNKMLFKEESKISESDAEAGPRFDFGTGVVAIWISRTQLFEINFEETLKGCEIIIEEE